MAKGGFNAKFGSRAMRPGETDTPNPAPGRQGGKGGLGGPPSLGSMGKAPKVSKVPPAMTAPPKRGRRGF